MESNAALVARVESFLPKEFSWYSRYPKSARETLQTLLAYVRDGAVVVLQESGATTNRFENGGFTLDPPARDAREDAPPFDYAARVAANSASLREYNDAIDARIERERRLNAPLFEDTKPLDMSFLLSVVSMVSRGENLRHQAIQKAAPGFSELADNTTTPLGNAAPFEYIKSATGDDVLSIAARGVSEAQESMCLAAYESALDLCGVLAFPMGARAWCSCMQGKRVRSISTM